ncbi:zinc transporter 1-like [Triticum dicoccoides]|uniref:zinc transporter 1-like n=1 Tax=Triticum dicoccoides TaxID=85692 RepID=UPI000E7D1BDB|nr:zinc transporter 1-like [Triticum dicoccoides]
MAKMARSTRRMSNLNSTLLLLSLLLLTCFFQQASGHGGVDHGDGDEDDEGHHGDVGVRGGGLRSRGLIAVKVWCLVILLVFTFLGGVSPYFYRWNEAFLLLGTQFAAGIFLGTALMHFLAGSTSTFNALTHSPYPFSFMLACAGFLLTMLSDVAIVAVANRQRVNQAAPIQKDAEEEGESTSAGPVAAHAHPMLMTATSSFEDAILLIFALCFHSIFEGIAIGVSATKGEAWRNLWTIGLHKIFAAVAMGIALLRMIPKRPFLMTVLYSLAFAVSSPVGVGIGIAIDATAEGPAADWTYAISMGIATGIFVYVAINHLMARGYRPQQPNYFDKPIFKFLGVLTGVAVMAVVMIWD